MWGVAQTVCRHFNMYVIYETYIGDVPRKLSKSAATICSVVGDVKLEVFFNETLISIKVKLY